MDRQFLLREYDSQGRVLLYDCVDGSSSIMHREQASLISLPQGFGAFVQERGKVFGIYASARGPVLFCNEQRLRAEQGKATASVHIINPKMQIYRYSVFNNGAFVFGTQYQARTSPVKNPSEKEIEAVDLFQMIAAGLSDSHFFANYRLELTNPERPNR